MRERLSRGAIVIALALMLALAIPAQAAPLRQQDTPSPPPPTDTPRPPTVTPSATAGRLPPQQTPANLTPQAGPTATLIAPPEGGGRVTVDALYVRAEPSFDSPVIGVLAFNQSVYPIGRNANNTWVAINWSDTTGWLYAGLVMWHQSLNFESLPVMAPANLTPLPTEGVTETPGTLAATATPSPQATPTARPTATPRPTRTPTATAVPPTSAPSTVSPTQASANASPASSAGPTGLDALPQGVKTGGIVAIGSIVLIGGAYTARRVMAQREVNRYRGGFPLTLCPVCLEGHIHVNEVVKTSLGIPRMTRSARCDACHSALREIRPGVWRYAVDAYRNPELAERFSSAQLSENDLKELAEKATEQRFQLELEREKTLESQLDLSWLDVSYDDDADSGGASEPEPTDDQPE